MVFRQLVELCHQSVDSYSLRVKALALLGEAIPTDSAYFGTADPATTIATSNVLVEYPTELCRPLLRNEFAEPDANKFNVLTHARIPVAGLAKATGGDLFQSRRYAELLRPIGLGDELRAAFRTRSNCWGMVCLHREDSASPYTSTEAAFLARIAPHLAEALRRTAISKVAVSAQADDGPGVALIAEDGSLTAATPAATRWLAELAAPDVPPVSPLPAAVLSVIARLHAVTEANTPEGMTPRLTARTAAGRWLTLHASQLTPETGGLGQTTVVIEPATPVHLAGTVVAAYGFTPRESDIAMRLLHGLTIPKIADECRISQFTVRDHCKAIFDKAGVNSRGELAASIYAATSAQP